MPLVPHHAPLTEVERLRIDGLLAGLYARKPQEIIPSPADDVTVLWASQTGRAETAARALATALGCPCIGLDTASANDLPAGNAIFVVSTFGDGDPPDGAASFWATLQARTTPITSLHHAVLAFGDSTYASFCGFGRSLDDRLSQLGSRPLLDRHDCEPDDDDGRAGWEKQLLVLLRPDKGRSVSPAPPAENARPAAVMVRLCRNELLTPPASNRQTRLIGFDISGADLSYEPGDALGVWPRNKAEIVERVLEALGHPEEEEIVFHPSGSMTLREALTSHFDLSRANAAMQAHLGMDAGYLPDMLATSRSTIALTDISRLFRKLQPRFYSIASSPSAYPDEVHLTMGVANTPYPGTCSTWLAGLIPGAEAQIFIQKTGHFRLPPDGTTPVIMIGPGTGIAPFRGFLQHRAALSATGGAWLFFGERHALSGFYFREELETLHSKGVLTRLDLAFSRDQEDRIYVQDRMNAAGADLWEWISRGAHVYVCGDAARMARDVDATLRGIVELHGQMKPEQAAEYVNDMSRCGRYARDVY
ncbi:diflavin oxidoreductase [Asaia prunellae]|uniref:diflavin oxidoreductase n=1 Tax=Asaia prunellae TaxID=610245 RepID=UPI000555FCC3|nr:sulfite reductase flavoprotein subunit alpha [Asaia prunellae]